MCGRLAIIALYKQLHKYLGIVGEPLPGGIERYNLPPSSIRSGKTIWEKAPVVRYIDGKRRLDSLAWPLVPHWSRGELPKYSTANCRSEPGQDFSETIKKKPAFRDAWKYAQRCLIPVSWFYEWDQHTKPKTPYQIFPLNEPFFTFAGLWDRSMTSDGEIIESFTIITAGPNQLLKDIGHHRAPVIIEPKHWDTWLRARKAISQELITAPAADEMAAREVSKAINNPAFDDKRIISPDEPDERTTTIYPYNNEV